jgi:membrane protease subunit HflK
MTSTWPEKRALTVSLVGLLFQAGMATFLFLLSLWNGSEANQAAALLAACGIPIWIFLALIYKQRQLVREETLESEQLRQERAAGGTGAALFAGDEERLLIARRRLMWMYHWLLPLFTVLTIVPLAALSFWYSWSFGTSVYDKTWPVPTNESLSFAFVIGVSFLAFLLSRYATGMARETEWRLLRAGAAYLMGNTLAGVAVAVVLGLVHFQIYVPERVAAYALRILMLLLAVEFLLNFVLDFYRPRKPGEEPRPAFDSRLLGLFCEPGGIARSIAEALNYQFGFEVSSTWFYKLMQRAITPVIGFGVLTMFAASCIVIVNAGEAVVVERFGRPLQSGKTVRVEQDGKQVEKLDALGPGLHLKYPWPIDVAYRYPVQQVQDVLIGVKEAGAKEEGLEKALTWTVKHPFIPELTVIVATSGASEGMSATQPAAKGAAPSAASDDAEHGPSERSVGVSLIRVAMPIQYRIKDLEAWRTKFTDPAKVFEELAYRELIKYSAGVDVDQVMGADRKKMADDLETIIQKKADTLGIGVQIITLGLQGVHPPSEVAKDFEAVVGAASEKQASIRTGESERNKILSEACGDVTRARQLATAISKLDAPGVGPEESTRARETIADLFHGNPAKRITPIGGKAAEIVAQARADMWKTINESRADNATFALELPVYRAAPRIYRMRKYMDVLSEGLKTIRKYLIATDVEPTYHLQLMDPTVANLEMALQGEKPQ